MMYGIGREYDARGIFDEFFNNNIFMSETDESDIFSQKNSPSEIGEDEALRLESASTSPNRKRMVRRSHESSTGRRAMRLSFGESTLPTSQLLVPSSSDFQTSPKKSRSIHQMGFERSTLPASQFFQKASPRSLPPLDLSTHGIEIVGEDDRIQRETPPTPCPDRTRTTKIRAVRSMPSMSLWGAVSSDLDIIPKQSSAPSLNRSPFFDIENDNTSESVVDEAADQSPQEKVYTKYLNIIRKLEMGEFEYNDKIFYVQKINKGAGKYKQAFILSLGQEQMIPNVPNKEIIIKAYHEIGLRRNKGQQDTMTRTSCEQYLQCLAKEIPVAEIYNFDKITNSLIGNVFIQRFVPNGIDCSKWKFRYQSLSPIKDNNIEGNSKKQKLVDPLKEKNPEDFPELVALRMFFEGAIGSMIGLDLNPGNLRYSRECGDMVLIDFREVIEEDDFVEIDVITNIFKDLENCSGRRWKVFNYLTENFTALNKDPRIAKQLSSKLRELEGIERRAAILVA